VIKTVQLVKQVCLLFLIIHFIESTNCLSCNVGYYFNKDDNVCYSPCPSYYVGTTNKDGIYEC